MKYILVAMLFIIIASCSTMQKNGKQYSCDANLECVSFNYYGNFSYGVYDLMADIITLPLAIIYFPFYLATDSHYIYFFNIDGSSSYYAEFPNKVDTKVAYEEALKQHQEVKAEAQAQKEKEEKEAEELKNQQEKEYILCTQNKQKEQEKHFKELLTIIYPYGYIKKFDDIKKDGVILDTKNVKFQTLKMLNSKEIDIYDEEIMIDIDFNINDKIFITKSYKKDMYVGKINKQSFLVIMPINKKNINYADEETAYGVIYKTNKIIEVNKKNLRVLILLPVLDSDIAKIKSKMEEYNYFKDEKNSCNPDEVNNEDNNSDENNNNEE